MAEATITIGTTGKYKTPCYKLTIPKEMGKRFVEKNGRTVDVSEFGDKLLIKKVQNEE